MTATEREAIEAGTVWWDADLFSGRPDWAKLAGLREPTLTAEEQSFLDVEVETLCEMITDWETTHVYRDLPPHVWQFIKDNGFLDRSQARDGVGYCVFGKVIEGLDIVDKIKNVSTTTRSGHQDVPSQDVVIKSARRVQAEAV